MSNTTSEQASPRKTAVALDRFLTRTDEQLAIQISMLEQQIAGIERLAPISEASERAKALARSKGDLSAATSELNHIVHTAGYGGLGAPVAAVKGWLSVHRARKNLEAVERSLDEPLVQTRREALVADHNNHVAAERARLPSLRTELNSCKEQHSNIVGFRRDVADALTATGAGGWTATDFASTFDAMAAQAYAHNIQDAKKYLAALRFQRRPAVTAYVHWEKEAWEIRRSAYASYAGMPASGAYTEIAARSIDLSHLVLNTEPINTLTSYSHVADRWQALSGVLTDPRNFKVDALWAIYWAMFQAGQSVEHALSQSNAGEDVFTGKLSAQIDRWLSDWAAKRVKEFGYPRVASYMATLEIASKSEETRLGADVGLIVDLELGDLQSRKVVLFQAKKTKRGVTDIGSTSGQLPKLTAVPSMGFYLFYHQSDFLVRAPAPTVCSAQDLAEAVKSRGRPLDAHHLQVNVRKAGWDLSSFVGFGLCHPESGLGNAFTTPADALSKLGSGNAGRLPEYLHVIAIADESRVFAMRRQILDHYRDLTIPLDRTHGQRRQQKREMDGPERMR